ncbi:MAG: hypothetical protein OXC63_04480 [Aestuariivita sp.]|nr:hypothetical protein [Aestuariivita sp.]MCY4345329.1 hypothetical protein [Aestuariivita sp.]
MQEEPLPATWQNPYAETRECGIRIFLVVFFAHPRSGESWHVSFLHPVALPNEKTQAFTRNLDFEGKKETPFRDLAPKVRCLVLIKPCGDKPAAGGLTL